MRHSNRVFVYILTLTALAINLSGCSRLDIALRWSDVFIAHYADGYFDLNSEQKNLIKQEVRNFIAEGKKTEFIEISKSMNNLADELDKKLITRILFNNYRERLNHHAEHFLKALAPRLSNLSGKLNTDQWLYFKKKVQDEIQDQKFELSNIQKFNKNRFNKIKMNFELWIGNITDSQEQEIHKYITQATFPWEKSWANKIQTIDQLISLKAQSKAQTHLIQDMIINIKKYRNPDFQNDLQAYQNQIYEMVWLLLSQTNDKQKTELASSLRKYSKMFLNLSI